MEKQRAQCATYMPGTIFDISPRNFIRYGTSSTTAPSIVPAKLTGGNRFRADLEMAIVVAGSAHQKQGLQESLSLHLTLRNHTL
jgi:hypothetical protein